MIEDCFEKWYSLRYQELGPEDDDFYLELLECYKAGWKRSHEVQNALEQITELSQEGGEYD